MFKVVIPQDITAAGRDYLKAHDCEVKVLEDCSVENICKEVVDADALLVRTTAYPAAVFEAAKKLKVVARYGAGVDNIDIEAATKHGVQVCNAPIANSNSVAEHTFMLLLACAKNLIIQDKACRKGDFVWGDRIFEKCGIRRDEEGDGGKTLEIRGKRRLSARDGGANYQQS